MIRMNKLAFKEEIARERKTERQSQRKMVGVIEVEKKTMFRRDRRGETEID